MNESSGSRRREAREFWEAAIRLQAESGLSVGQFCKREGLTEYSFYWWRRKLLPKDSPLKGGHDSFPASGGDPISDGQRQRHGKKRIANPTSGESPAVDFMPVRVLAEGKRPQAPTTLSEAATKPSPIEIVHASGWRVRVQVGFSPTVLESVLTMLERRPC